MANVRFSAGNIRSIYTTRASHSRDWSNKTKASINEMLLAFIHRAVNSENDKVNNIKNQLTGEYGAVPDTARDYKVNYIKKKGSSIFFGLGKYLLIT